MSLNDIRRKTLFIGCAIGLVSMGACTSIRDVNEAASMTPTGSPFTQSLHKEYVDLAKFEVGQGDRSDARHYALKAKDAAAGKAVSPDDFTLREIAAPENKTLMDARSRLVSTLGGPEAAKKPETAAKAQSMFDCWMEQQEEGWQYDHIAACRKGFDTAMAALAPEKMAAAPGPQTVYFKFNSAELTEKSQQDLATVVRDYKLAKPKSVNVVTYTDLSGSKEYNAKLAAMRGKSLEGQLKQSGVEAIKVDARGAVEPVVDTSKPNQENRRAVIIFN